MADTNIGAPESKLDIDYLMPADQILIQPFIPDIIADATQYIDNLNSEKMRNYTKYHHLVYTKYAGRKYKIETPLNQIIVHTSDGQKTLITIHKPGYIRISSKLAQYKQEINQARAELDTHYFHMKLITTGVTPAEKDDFLTKKKNFITLLKKYYTILAYVQLRDRMKSNVGGVNESVETGDNVLINYANRIEILKDISGSMQRVPIIDSKIISVPREQVSRLQQYQSDKLNQYNEIITLLGNKSTDGLKEKIVAYLDNTGDVEFKPSSDAYADIIVADLPQIMTNM